MLSIGKLAIGNLKRMDHFRTSRTDRILVFDGAMGTMLYAKGVYINRCYDELNLSNPDLVREIHAEYIRAGADIIETNTFGATAHKLQQYGLEGNLHEINAQRREGRPRSRRRSRLRCRRNRPTRLAHRALWSNFVRRSEETCSRRRRQRCSKAVSISFCLETFSDVSEMRQAIRAVRELCDLPIIAQMTIMTDGNTMFGTTPELFTERLDEWGADVIGLNCGVGPAIILTALEKMRDGHEEEAVRAAKRGTAARRSGPTVLHVLA